jgi:5'(3')-deoxyribonucleotidase
VSHIRNKFTVAVDVDEVCADLLGTWLMVYNREHGTKLLPEDIKGWDIGPFLLPGTKDRFYELLRSKYLYDNVIPIPYARQAVQEIRSMGHRVIFVTACTRGTVESKLHWLENWGFINPDKHKDDYIPVTDKYLIRADFLFDDRPLNVREFTKAGGCGVLIRREHNSHETWNGLSLPSLREAPDFIRSFVPGTLHQCAGSLTSSEGGSNDKQ